MRAAAAAALVALALCALATVPSAARRSGRDGGAATVVVAAHGAAARGGGIDGAKLALVQVVFRHGDRTPTNRIDVSPVEWKCTANQLETPSAKLDAAVSPPPDRLFSLRAEPGAQILEGNCLAGQLTDIGLQQGAALGASLRQRYISQLGFLSDTYVPGQVTLRSTDVRRSVQTAQSLFRSLYPSIASSSSSSLPVIPLVTRDDSREDMHINPTLCPYVMEELAKHYASVNFTESLAAIMAPVLVNILRAFNTSDPLKAIEYYDNLDCRQHHQLPFPQYIDDHVFDVLTTMYYLVGQVMFTTCAPGLGTFYQTLLDNMANAAKTPDVRLRLFSGHDTSVGPLLAALNAFNGTWPPYTADVTLELWLDTSAGNAPYVRALYLGDALALPGCNASIAAGALTQLCSLDDFAALLAPSIPADFEHFCAAKAFASAPGARGGMRGGGAFRGVPRVARDILRRAWRESRR